MSIRIRSYGALADRVSFFVDEDPKRIGRQCAGKPIYSPQEAPRGSTVFVPLAPGIAAKVAARHQHAAATFVASPPAIASVAK